MKFNLKRNQQLIYSVVSMAIFFMALVITSCSKDEEPQKEDVPELITKATLTFTPTSGDLVVVTATDPDGIGVKDLTVDGAINLRKDQTYVLTIQLLNGLAQPTDDEYNVTDEVESEGDEHQFFFAWTKGVFADPSGNGNIDNGTDALNYSGGATSKDKNGRALGLTTTWTTTDAVIDDASFHVLLKHQPDLKSDTSDSNSGETDLDITFVVNVE